MFLNKQNFKFSNSENKKTIFSYDYKLFKNLLTKYDEKYKCIYINKYGEKCKNNCLKVSPFKLREFFCEYHIKNYIHFIINFIEFVSNFIKIENKVNLIFNQYYRSSKFNSEKIKIKNTLNNLLYFLTENYKINNQNEEFLLICQPILIKLKTYYFKSISLMIYDTFEYRNKINMLNLYKYDCIISRNIQKRKDIILMLKELSNDNNNYIGKTFKETKIGDINIIDIIGNFF
jgi:hypothetical protein